MKTETDDEKKSDSASTPMISRFDAVCIRRGFPKRHVQRRDEQRKGEWANVLDSVRGFIGKGSLIVLHGKRGTGKTQIACDAARPMLERQCNATALESRYPLYTLARDLFLDIRTAFRKDSDCSEAEMIRKYFLPSILVIDEAQERGETEFEDRTLTQIVDKRYGAMVDTILISNLTKEEFAKSLGQSIVSRIHETGAVFECNWESFRQKPAKGDA